MEFIKLLLSYLVWFSKKFSRENLYKFIDETIEKYISIQNLERRKIINIGAGGEIGKFIKKKLLNVIEVDIDKDRNPDLILDIQNMYLISDNSIDVIFCLEVLEHVQKPFKAVSEIYRVLKPRGIIIGSVPFVFPIHDEPYDYFRFTKYGLLDLFKDFKCLKLVERNSYIKSWYVILLRLINVGTLKQRIVWVVLFPFMILILPIVIILDTIVTNKQSTTGYFFIFKKLK